MFDKIIKTEYTEPVNIDEHGNSINWLALIERRLMQRNTYENRDFGIIKEKKDTL